MNRQIKFLLLPLLMFAAGCSSEQPASPQQQPNPQQQGNPQQHANPLQSVPRSPIAQVQVFDSINLQMEVETTTTPSSLPAGSKSYPVVLGCNGKCVWKGDTVTLEYRGVSHKIGFEIEVITIVFDPSHDTIRSLRYTSECTRKLGTLTSEYGEEKISAEIVMVDVPLVRKPDGSRTFEVAGDKLRKYVGKAEWEIRGFQNSLGNGGKSWGSRDWIADHQPSGAKITLVIK